MDSTNRELTKFLSSIQTINLTKENGITFLQIDKQTSEGDITELLEYLWNKKYDIAFYDAIVNKGGEDPGAYFSYSSKSTITSKTWGMTYGNHGWSGGIYHITSKTLTRQIFNLIQNTRIEKIQISNVTFFSQYDVEPEEKSSKKDSEINKAHKEN